MEFVIKSILAGSLLVVGLHCSTQKPLISSTTCQRDVFKKHRAKDTGDHVEGTGERETVLFDALLSTNPKNNKIAAMDCYIYSGSMDITDANFVNVGKAESGFEVFTSSKKVVQFRLNGDKSNTLSYQVTLWGKKDGKATKEVKPTATCCNVE